MENRNEIDRLRSRWSANDIKVINQCLAAGEIWENATSHDIDGVKYVDLRGLTLTTPIHHKSFSRLDLSYSVADVLGQLVVVTLRDCKLVGADLSHTNIGRHMISCDFTGASLKILRGTFEDCRFVRANMTKVKGTQVAFIRCDFTDANMRKTDLYHSTFEHCVWGGNKFRSGSFGGSRFIGARPDPVALGNTIMESVIFQ